jgi:hypothetical protein
MQAKHIIVGILALAGLVFGAYNWYNYIKSTAPGSALEAVRPPQQQQGTSSEAAPRPMVSGSTEDQSGPPEGELPAEQVEWPDTAGRNPFLTPREVELIARGELVEEELPAPVSQSPGVTLPELKLNGLIMDRVTGSYRALIDGKAYNTGDQIGQEKIIEITASSVTLEYGGRTRTVLLELSRNEKKSSSGINLKEAP